MKALFYGIAGATAAGLLAGGGLKPDALALTDERPQGPQIFVTAPSMRTALDPDGWYDAGTYRGAVPDYVVGTDLLRPIADAPQAYDIQPAIYRPEPKPAPEPETEQALAPAEDPSTSALAKLDLIAEQIAAAEAAAALRTGHPS